MTRGASSQRLSAVDALRGLIMVLMALDHANYFIAQKHSPGEYWGGPFPVYHQALPFVTRLVTHLAAPGFFFLMGVGIALLASSRLGAGWSKGQITRHLLLRGALLIVIQLLLVNPIWESWPSGWSLEVYIGVLFALGGGLILGGLLLWLDNRLLLVLAAALLLGTELLVPEPALWGKLERQGLWGQLNTILLHPGGTRALWATYPVLPWLELVLFGLLFGRWLDQDRNKALRLAPWLGLGLLVAFVILRALGGFGVHRPPAAGGSWIDFFNVTKYPPSLAFTALTMGVNLLLLGGLSRLREPWLRPLLVVGRTPLFFYLAHLALYAVLGRWLTPEGTTIPTMLPYWLAGLLILYPLCLWYGRFRGRQPLSSPLRLF